MSSHTSLSKPPVSARSASIKRVLWIVFFLNLGVAAAKYVYGGITGSTSMQADGIHSIFDSAGNVVGLIGIALASRPADATHPYGHAKFETYASLVIGVFLLLAAFEVGSSAIEKLVTGVHSIEVTPVSFIVMLITLIVNIGVSVYERRYARVLRSEVLRADSNHTLSDACVSVGVIVGLIFVAFGFPIADPIMALVVMCAILATALDVFKQGLRTLSDRVRIPEKDIHELVLGISGVKNVHHIRTRGTEGEVYLDMHVLVSPDTTVLAAHKLTENIEGQISQMYPQVIETLIHIEPDDGHID